MQYLSCSVTLPIPIIMDNVKESGSSASKRGPYKRYLEEDGIDTPRTTKWRQGQEASQSDNSSIDVTETEKLHGEVTQYQHADDEPDVDFVEDIACPAEQYVLDEFMDIPNAEQDQDTPLYRGSRLTISASMLLIFSFAMRHSPTAEGLCDLLTLVELHCLAENICCTTLKRYKDFFLHLKSPIRYVYFCEDCYKYYGSNRVTICDICKKTGTV